MARITLLLLFMFLASCMFDASAEDEADAKYKWGVWNTPTLISIADDSLALLAIYKDYYKEWNQCGLFGCATTASRPANYRVGLFLVNYRKKRKPVWGDTLECNLVIAGSYFKDSSVLVFDRNDDKFGFWKIGTKAKDVKLIDYTNNSGKGNRLYNYKVRPLANGNIAFFSSEKAFRNSLLLETKNRQLKLFEFSGEYEWLSKCANSLKKYYCSYLDDGTCYADYNYDYANVSYIGGELACIKANETTNNFELTVNDVVRDTSSLSKSSSERITNWYGRYVKDAEDKFYKIDTLNFKFDSSYIPMWNSYCSYCFYKENKNSDSSVDYFAQDLIGSL